MSTEETMADELANLHEVADRVAKIGSSEMTEKVGKLLRQAESLPEDSPERTAFMDRAMALSAAYSIDLALARAQQAKKEKVEEPEERQYQVGQVGRNWGRVPSKSNAHFVDLMIAICKANDLEVLISHSNVYVYAHGMPSDHEVAERMFAILSVQMVAEADKALRNGANKTKKWLPKTRRVAIPEEERAWGAEYADNEWEWDPKRYASDEDEVGGVAWRWVGSRHGERQVSYTLKAPPTHRIEKVLDAAGNEIMEEKVVSDTDARVWRVNFYAGFVQRTRSRLREAKKQALKHAGIDLKDEESSGALALLDKKKVVRESFEENNRYVLATENKSKGYTGAEVSSHDWSAHEKGQQAANNARLGDEKDLGEGE